MVCGSCGNCGMEAFFFTLFLLISKRNEVFFFPCASYGLWKGIFQNGDRTAFHV